MVLNLIPAFEDSLYRCEYGILEILKQNEDNGDTKIKMARRQYRGQGQYIDDIL